MVLAYTIDLGCGLIYTSALRAISAVAELLVTNKSPWLQNRVTYGRDYYSALIESRIVCPFDL